MLSCIVITCCSYSAFFTQATTSFPAQKSFLREKVSKYHYLEEITF